MVSLAFLACWAVQCFVSWPLFCVLLRLCLSLSCMTRQELQEMEELRWGPQGLLYAMQGANSRHMEKDSTLNY